MQGTLPRLLVGVLALGGGLSAHAVEPMPAAADQFTEVQRLIKPTVKEDRWNRIPWQSSLWEARKLAAAKGKPIFLWEMDGHPLGCT
jgi:hypothetical protein